MHVHIHGIVMTTESTVIVLIPCFTTLIAFLGHFHDSAVVTSWPLRFVYMIRWRWQCEDGPPFMKAGTFCF